MNLKNVPLLYLIMVIFFSFPVQVIAQDADTLDIPGNTVGVINKTIMEDTTATGERNNINRVYRLERGKIYYLTAGMDIRFPLRLIANDDDPGNPTHPPIIAPAILQDYSSPELFVAIYEGNCTLKNLYFIGFRPDQRPLNMGTAIVLLSDNTRLIVDNCVFDGWSPRAIRDSGKFNKLYITNCNFRNMQHHACWFCGQAFLTSVLPSDTVVMLNNTMFSSGSYFFCSNREICNYARIEHNTIFLNQVNPFYSPYLSKAIIKNNIFYGNIAMGITEFERVSGWFDWKGEISSLASIDTIDPALANRDGILEADRDIEFSNNVYFWPQKIKDFWTITLQDTVYQPLWMNTRTQNMFEDDTNYPNLIAENNINTDPQFQASVTSQIDSLLKYCLKIRSRTQTDYRWWYNPNDDLFGVQWPLPEDLSYNNSDLFSAGDDGFPVGDLNWFPDKKAEWEELVSGVETEEMVKSNKTLELHQNYPNPFNTNTVISWQLAVSSDVELSVYNILGQKVKTLVSGKQKVGVHMVVWDATGFASGLYMYILSTDQGFSRTKKLLLIK